MRQLSWPVVTVVITFVIVIYLGNARTQRSRWWQQHTKTTRCYTVNGVRKCETEESQSCDCNGRSNRCFFDPQLFEQTGHGGHCQDCTGNTDGPHCERCKENYYQRADGICIACNCDRTGSRSLQCDRQGRCPCKPGVAGEKCDRCEVNHYDFGPYGCRPCSCEVSGSFGSAPTCDPVTGICRCKENVEGQKCDSCKPGYFSLDNENEFGCSPCFCFGHSSICRVAPGYTKYNISSNFLRDSERWFAEDSSGRPVSITHNSVTANLAVTSFSDKVYFVAPDRFLGDQRAAYNQYLTFSLHMDAGNPNPTIQDIVIERSGLSIYQPIFGQNNPVPSSVSQRYRFRLHEAPNFGWNPRLSTHDFLSLLSNVTAIRIRATYTPGSTGYLDDVSLMSAQRIGVGENALFVEMCTCPDGYVGQFCESCSPGFRHDPPNGGPFAKCIPCNCHGHADICDAETGRCICRHNTAGENCERCARGYYGNALIGTPNDCRPCPCPNQGACMELLDKEVICLECPSGYAGPRCDLCTDGYYGDPQGRNGPPRPCQRCDCSGNVDTNAVGNCNRTTGECLKCIYSTYGSRCEQCLPGYYGDALALPKGDCKTCSCYRAGTRAGFGFSDSCNPITGQCDCLPYVVGQRCDACEEGYYNLVSGTGCQLCNCDPVGSDGIACDIQSGQCNCRTGVTGLQCNRCAPYHWGFSADGCHPCDCDTIGARSAQCDPYGQCECRPNVEGLQCERCKENTYNKTLGCIPCPPCYNLVQQSVTELRVKLEELKELLSSIEQNPEIVNDLNFEFKLQEVQRHVELLLQNAISAQGGEGDLSERLGLLRDRINDVKSIADRISTELVAASGKSQEGVRNITIAEDAIRRAQDALRNAQRYLETDGIDALSRARKQAEKFGQQSERMSQIARESRLEADRQELDAKEIEALAAEAKNTSGEAYIIARAAINQQDDTRNEIRNLKDQLRDVTDLLETTKRASQEAQNRSVKAYDEALEIYTTANLLQLPEVNVPKMESDAAEIIDEARRIQNDADDLMNRNRDLLLKMEQQGSEAEALLSRGGEQQQIADALLADADAALDKANRAVEMGEKTLQEAQRTLETLKGFDKLVQDSKVKAEDALKLVPEIRRLIEEAEKKTEDAQKALIGAKQDADDALKIAQEAQKIAEKSSDDAHIIRNEADKTKEQAGRLKDQADALADEVAVVASRMKELEEQAGLDKERAKQAVEKATEAKTNAQGADEKVQGALRMVNEISDIISKLDPIDQAQLDSLERKLNRTEQELNTAKLDERLEQLREARLLQNSWMRSYEEELERLRKEVSNIQAIRDSLPNKCYRRVTLEPP